MNQIELKEFLDYKANNALPHFHLLGCVVPNPTFWGCNELVGQTYPLPRS